MRGTKFINRRIINRRRSDEKSNLFKTVLWAVAVFLITTSVNAQTFTSIDVGLTGVISSSSTWGDFDGDNDLDLVINGYNSSEGGGLTIIYENENQDFSESGAELLGTNLGDVDWGDYDDDGDLDLVITGDDGSNTEYAAIYQNNGDGTFTDIEAGLLGVDESAANWGDLDGDGDLDLLITGADSSNNQTAIVYQNDEGTFTEAEAGLTGVDDSCSDLGDFDNDGDLDLVIAGAETAFDIVAKIYENDDGTFTDIETGLTGVEEGSCDWGDYDADGDLDLVLAGVDANDDNSATIYRNDNGEFIDIEAGLEGVEESSSQWGDFDNDGDLDLVITGSDTNGDPSTTVYRNDEGSFTPIDEEFIGVENGSSSWGDFDADGDLDLVITGEGQAVLYQNQSDGATSIEEGTTPAEFALKQNYPNPFNPSTKIQFELPRNTMVSLTVYNMLGQEIITLVNNEQKLAGKHSIRFQSDNLTSGMYIYRLKAGDAIITKKMTLIK